MWRQTQRERWRGWLMFIQHCILLALLAGRLSSLPPLMGTTCPTGGWSPIDPICGGKKNSDRGLRPLLLFLSFSASTSHSVHGSPVKRGLEFKLKKKKRIFHLASTTAGHSWTGMFGILVCTDGAEIHPVGTLVKNEWRAPSRTWDLYASYILGNFRQGLLS